MSMTGLTAADGHRLECWMQPAQGAAKGGVVILQEIFGVTEQLKGVADLYAAAGYDVAIPALFDRQEKGAVIPFNDPSRGRDLMLASNLDQTVLDIASAVQALAARDHKVGVIGFCWGGGLALRAAQVLDVSTAIAFYGTRLTSYLDRPLKAPMQAHCGKTDDHTPADVMDEVQSYLPQIEIHWYDAGHAFANDARPTAYVAKAAELAHDRSKAFLARHLA